MPPFQSGAQALQSVGCKAEGFSAALYFRRGISWFFRDEVKTGFAFARHAEGIIAGLNGLRWFVAGVFHGDDTAFDVRGEAATIFARADDSGRVVIPTAGTADTLQSVGCE
jgi:hypothetical protein